MDRNRISFYLSHNNVLFKGDVLVMCYQFLPEELKKYNLTSNNAVVFIKHKNINCDNFIGTNNVNYINVIKELFKGNKIYLRLQSECFLGMYGDSHCDCETQRLKAIEFISENNGIYIHIPQEAQGWGLFYKLQELELQLTGRMPNGKRVGVKTRDEAQKILLNSDKFNDIRDYSFIKEILTSLGLESERIVILTSSEKKVHDLLNLKLNVEKLSDSKSKEINVNNLSEYLIKLLNQTHNFSNDDIFEILNIIKNSDCNERSLSTFLEIVKKIKAGQLQSLNKEMQDEIMNTYSVLICGEEKSFFIGDKGEHKIQNHFCCKVSSSIFKTLYTVFNKNIFDRVSLEKLYYFKNKHANEMVKIRTSEILKIRDDKTPFFEGQHHAEERIVDYDRDLTIQNDVPISRLKLYVENNNYDFVKQVEMITTISEYDVEGAKIFIKRIPTLDYRIMDIFAKKEDVRNILNKLLEADNSSILSTVTNKKYEDENFTKYNLRFADLTGIISEELEIYKLLKGDK